MRAIRTTTISILAIGLLAGSAVGVASQDEASSVTGTVGASTVIGEPSSSIADGVEHARGLVREGPIEMSDPRLTGSLLRVLNFSFHPVGDDGALAVETNLWRIEGVGGSWSGPSQAISHVGDIPTDVDADLETLVLTGEDDFDGLSAYLVADWSPAVGAEVEGAIFAGEMPPVPELPSE